LNLKKQIQQIPYKFSLLFTNVLCRAKSWVRLLYNRHRRSLLSQFYKDWEKVPLPVSWDSPLELSRFFQNSSDLMIDATTWEICLRLLMEDWENVSPTGRLGLTGAAQPIFPKQLRFDPTIWEIWLRLLMELQSRNMLKLLHLWLKFSPFSANEDIFGVQYKQTMLIRQKKDHAFGQIIKCRTIYNTATFKV
jgi:hypothetical protein